jgi:hypothetical protein
MATLDLLDDDELERLTGSPQAKRQVEWLRREGFSFRVGLDGRPKVLTEHALAVLGSASAPVRRKGPNLDALARG